MWPGRGAGAEGSREKRVRLGRRRGKEGNDAWTYASVYLQEESGKQRVRWSKQLSMERHIFIEWRRESNRELIMTTLLEMLFLGVVMKFIIPKSATVTIREPKFIS